MTQARLMIGDSEHDADMLYLSGIFVPDPWIAVELGGRWHGLFSALEVDRARRTSRLDVVELDTEWRRQARERFGAAAGLAGAAACYLEAHGVTCAEVPAQFPFGCVGVLQRAGIAVRACSGPFFPQRARKRPEEIRELARAERLTARAMGRAIDFLGACSIGDDGVLRHPDRGRARLRAADLRGVIEQWLIARGAVPSHTIVACGRQGADPHNEGRGLLYAHRPIIIDIFPRLTASGYWGDMTRTVVKGRAEPLVAAMHRAVAAAQRAGLEAIGDGVAARTVHRRVQAVLEQHGFTTGVRRGRRFGFFHGTGHGVGLEVHEAPRISDCDDLLCSGQVVTVEPGLYDPRVGGVRIEDLVVVTETGCRNLTRFPRRLEIA
ncbi:MAG: aminopeptidase P family protein [Zetaproteobacteria bacterium]|nr:MAG: aminopeptidase P family protein [Zetaproteobacteria bacterium]